MADTLTIKFEGIRADETGVNPTNSATATDVGEKEYLIGPPLYSTPYKAQGRYARQIAGASGTFQWLFDERIDATSASPTTYKYVST